MDIIGNNAQECKKFVFAVKRLRDECKNTLFALLLSRKFIFPIMSNILDLKFGILDCPSNLQSQISNLKCNNAGNNI